MADEMFGALLKEFAPNGTETASDSFYKYIEYRSNFDRLYFSLKKEMTIQFMLFKKESDTFKLAKKILENF